jgi:NTE family protein
MNKGTFVDLLPFCLSFPPLFRPHQQNVAGVLSLKALVDYLRAKGANHIIYVDVLSGAPKINNADMETQILWSLAAESLSHQEKGLDYVLHVPLKDVDLLDFNRRREVIQKGQQAAVEASSQILKNVNW